MRKKSNKRYINVYLIHGFIHGTNQEFRFFSFLSLFFFWMDIIDNEETFDFNDVDGNDKDIKAKNKVIEQNQQNQLHRI